MDKAYTLAHCISKDCEMGMGIALHFNELYPEMKHKMKNTNLKVGDAVYYNDYKNNPVINLITKEKYYDKPTRLDFNDSLRNMRDIIIKYEIKKLAIPLLGAGLDKLNWSVTQEKLYHLFNDLDIELVVCYY